MAQINQADANGVPQALIRFRDAVGAGRVVGPKIEVGRLDLYWWVASSYGDVRRTGTLIGPWLSTEKRDQFHSAVGIAFDQPPIDSFSWAAGLFDAEGSVSLSDHHSHRGYKVIEAAVTQGGQESIPEELVRMHALLKRGNVNGPYSQEGANELIYRWRASRVDDVRTLLHLLDPWLGRVKRAQALGALRVMDAQRVLPRGRLEWGSHKTHCIHGHEYATARLRPYVSRGRLMPIRENHRCLTCLRELARRKRAEERSATLPAADCDTRDDRTTC